MSFPGSLEEDVEKVFRKIIEDSINSGCSDVFHKSINDKLEALVVKHGTPIHRYTIQKSPKNTKVMLHILSELLDSKNMMDLFTSDYSSRPSTSRVHCAKSGFAQDQTDSGKADLHVDKGSSDEECTSDDEYQAFYLKDHGYAKKRMDALFTSDYSAPSTSRVHCAKSGFAQGQTDSGKADLHVDTDLFLQSCGIDLKTFLNVLFYKYPSGAYFKELKKTFYSCISAKPNAEIDNKLLSYLKSCVLTGSVIEELTPEGKKYKRRRIVKLDLPDYILTTNPTKNGNKNQSSKSDKMKHRVQYSREWYTSD